MLSSAAPTVAASAPVEVITEACKLPSQRVTSDYRLTLNITESQNVVKVTLDGEVVGFRPATISSSQNVLVVGETENANSKILFEIITDRGVIRQEVKALPCKN
jgi:hypothetical protein